MGYVAKKIDELREVVQSGVVVFWIRRPRGLRAWRKMDQAFSWRPKTPQKRK